MVRYKYIGRTNWQCGKTLWEIIGNLKDYGVGRLVTRGTWQHYEQPSFLKIIKAEPYSLAEEDEKPGRYRKCIVVVEKIFRGLRYPELIEIFKVSFKPDYRLIPKEEEDLWYKRAIECEKYIPSFLPTHVTVPPTLKLILNEERKAKGLPVDEDMLIEAKLSNNTSSMVARQNLKDLPPKVVPPLFERPAGVSLYDNIEAYRDAFLREDK